MHYGAKIATVLKRIIVISFISGGWIPLCSDKSSFQGVPLYTEGSSFHRVGIERFHCIQRCPR